MIRPYASTCFIAKLSKSTEFYSFEQGAGAKHPAPFFSEFVDFGVKEGTMRQLRALLAGALLFALTTQVVQARPIAAPHSNQNGAQQLAATPASTRIAPPTPNKATATATVKPELPLVGTPTKGPATVTTVNTPTATATQPATEPTPDPVTLPIGLPPPISLTVPVSTSVSPLLTGTEDLVTQDAAFSGSLESTVVVNRTELAVRFFVEGKTYELPARRSLGVQLPRVTAVLNLYNCEANRPETTQGCYWDPYLLDQNGFYEIIPGFDDNKPVSLSLRPAGSPPADQVWIQNRTGKRSAIVYNNQVIELPPSSVREFTTTVDAPTVFHLSSCLTVAGRTVCEWSPKVVETGYYFALVTLSLPGKVPNSQINMLELEPIVAKDGATPDAPKQVVCKLQVPAINIRSGPGLEYQILTKVRSNEDQPGTVLVVGRSPDSQWLAVDERIATNGWVTSNGNFVQCAGDVAGLPIAEGPVVQPPPAAAPAATTVDNTANNITTQAPPVEPPIEPTVEPTATLAAGLPVIPDSQALLIVNNGFDQPMRFTLDQRFRVEVGSSKFDLQPGQSVHYFRDPRANSI